MQSFLFIFSVLGLLGVLLLTTTVTNNNSNYFYALNQPVYAQDEDEDEEEDSSKDKDEDEEDSSKDEEDEEQESESEESSNETSEEPDTTAIAEPLEQLSDQYLDVTETKQELQAQTEQVLSEEQVIKEHLNQILIDGNWTNPNDNQTTEEQQPPIFNLTNDQILQQLDPSCNCTDPQNPPSMEPPIPNQTFTPSPSIAPQGLQQIIIDPSKDIKNYQSFGKITKPVYANFYNATNVLDNKIDEYSFWSQYGESGFLIELFPNVLQNWEVCSAEIVAHDPKGVPSILKIGASKNYNGVLDSVNEKIDFDSCVRNVDKIIMSFDAPEKFTSISEVKLFGKLLNQPQPTPQPQPGGETGNTTKILIRDSNAEISIIDSNVTFKFDPQSAQATNYNVITVPNPTVGAKN